MNKTSTSTILPSALNVKTIANDQADDDDFISDILSRFHDDEIGTLCATDETIRTIGRRLQEKNKRKVDKTQESKTSVMSDMRLMARL